MKVESVIPAPAAASVSHPGHARWVKEKTLAMEVEHAKLLGGTSRDAEDENARQLERMEGLAREGAAPSSKPPAAATAPRPSHEERVAARGVSMRELPKQRRKQPQKVKLLKMSPCGRCGTCRRCMCERRILAISQKANAGDQKLLELMWPFALMATHAANRTGPFLGVRQRDVDRILARASEDLCDKSIRLMGEWR